MSKLDLFNVGAKLVALKQQLAGRIKEKREHARQVRQEAYDLDNEAGALDIEEEEAEMSDRSDTDDEEEGAIGEEEDYDEEVEDGMEADVEEEEREVAVAEIKILYFLRFCSKY